MLLDATRIRFIAPLFAYNFGFAFIAHTISFIIISFLSFRRRNYFAFLVISRCAGSTVDFSLRFDERCSENVEKRQRTEKKNLCILNIVHVRAHINTLRSGRFNSFDGNITRWWRRRRLRRRKKRSNYLRNEKIHLFAVVRIWCGIEKLLEKNSSASASASVLSLMFSAKYACEYVYAKYR